MKINVTVTERIGKGICTLVASETARKVSTIVPNNGSVPSMKQQADIQHISPPVMELNAQSLTQG